MNDGAGVFFQVIHRVTSSFCLSLVNVLNTMTDLYMQPLEGMCLAVLVFILAEIGDHCCGGIIRFKLFKRVCLLYCNQRARSLVAVGDTEAVAIANLFLAIVIAVLLMILESKGYGNSGDLSMLLMGVMYLYGDMFDFVLEYGVFTVTVCAFALSLWLESWKKPPEDKVYAFIWNLAQFASTNLLHTGITVMVKSTTELEVLECMAVSAVLPLILPSMQSYLTYLAAQRLMVLIPGYGPVFLCVVIVTSSSSILPASSKGWFCELCFLYVAMCIGPVVRLVPVPGIVFVVVLLHYVDYMLTMIFERRQNDGNGK
jgi:hypothetical protein